MLQRPTLKRHYHCRVVPGEGAVLLSERGDRVLCGELFETVLPLLTGRYTADEIVDLLAHKHAAAEVYYVLMALEDGGYLADGEKPISITQPAVWHAVDAAATLDIPQIADTTVRLASVQGLPTEECGAALRRHGFSVEDSAELTVVLTDDYLRPEIAEFNESALNSAEPWLLAKPYGSILWIGPLFLPGEGCCWRCVEHRMRPNRPAMSYLIDKGLDPIPDGPRTGGGNPSYNAAASLIASRLAAWIVRRPGETFTDAITTHDTLERVQTMHAVARRPQCPACGDATLYTRQASRPVEIRSVATTYTDDGGHRSVSPVQTLARHDHLIGPITGVVSDIRRFAFDDRCPTHVFASGFHDTRHHESLAQVRKGLQGRNSGKGISRAQARASALGESIERYSGVFQGDEPRKTASLEDLGNDAIHPNQCMGFSEAQYRMRDEWNAAHPDAERVPEPLDPSASVEWTPVWSLTEQKHRYLPTRYLYFGYAGGGGDFAWAESNGNAAGNVLEEAILQGTLELVERDCVCLWWYNRLAKPALEPEDVNSAFDYDLAAYYRDLGRAFWVLDITSDLGIPCFAAVSRQLEGDETIVLGFGAHVDAAVAAKRAVTEMNQILTSVRITQQDDRPLEPQMETWVRNATVAEHTYLSPSGARPTTLSDFPTAASANLADDVLQCKRLVEERGLEMLVLDQTRPDIGFAVAKVIVPGLRHIRPRFAPGRLYDVPVAMGWLAEPLVEAELNPVPMFL